MMGDALKLTMIKLKFVKHSKNNDSEVWLCESVMCVSAI